MKENLKMTYLKAAFKFALLFSASLSKISLFLISSRTLLLSKAHELLISHVQLTST